MKSLTVLYDEKCGLCKDLKNWVLRQPLYLPLNFIPAGSQQAVLLFPGLVDQAGPVELIVVSDEGGVYQDTQAYIMCLYALENYREWAFRLSTPTLMPLVRQAFRLIARNRTRLSDWFGLEGEAQLATKLKSEMLLSCDRSGNRSGIRCPYCKGEVANREGVYCPECGAIHHRGCWIENHYRCSIFGCAPDERRAFPAP